MLAALRLIGLSGAAVIALLVGALLAKYIGSFVLDYLRWALVGLWVVFTVFTFYFFRDPDPMVPTGSDLVIAPGHGKVDAITRRPRRNSWVANASAFRFFFQ